MFSDRVGNRGLAFSINSLKNDINIRAVEDKLGIKKKSRSNTQSIVDFLEEEHVTRLWGRSPQTPSQMRGATCQQKSTLVFF